MKRLSHILTALLALGLMMPFTAFAQANTTTSASFNINPNGSFTQSSTVTTPTNTYQFQSDGIYGCNKTSAAASSVGAFSASGAYVPVSDAAVELNTGYLVYLDCTLNPLVSALSQSAIAGLTQKITVAYNTGNNGNPQFSVNINNENLTVANNTVVSVVPTVMNAVNAALKGNVQTAVVQGYQSATQQPTSALNCPYTGDLNALLNGSTFSWAGLAALQNPACNALGAYQISNNLVNGYVANAVQNNMTQLQWGRGTYPIVDANGNVVTPGAVVLSQLNQALQSGFTKTESAVAIGQMVSALFAGIGAQAVSSAQGLAGITQSIGGQPSYISQVTTAASQAVQTGAVNAAIGTLNGVLSTVTGYLNELNTIANTFIQAIQSLQGTESQCWANIISNVCVAGSLAFNNGVATCTQVPGSGTATTIAPGTVTLTIATSTAFSNAVIQSQIAPAANQTATQIQSAQGSVAAVNQLIAGVTNTTSSDAQTLALQQLDQLTASNSFPSPSVISSVQQQATTVTTAMQSLVNQTVQNWQGIDSNGTQDLSWDGTVAANTLGWCNYNDPKTLAEWESVWK